MKCHCLLAANGKTQIQKAMEKQQSWWTVHFSYSFVTIIIEKCSKIMLECNTEDCRLLWFYSWFSPLDQDMLVTRVPKILIIMNKRILVLTIAGITMGHHIKYILWEAPFTYQISATHDSWYCLSLNWCWLLIVVPWKQNPM